LIEAFIFRCFYYKAASIDNDDEDGDDDVCSGICAEQHNKKRRVDGWNKTARREQRAFEERTKRSQQKNRGLNDTAGKKLAFREFRG